MYLVVEHVITECVPDPNMPTATNIPNSADHVIPYQALLSAAVRAVHDVPLADDINSPPVPPE